MGACAGKGEKCQITKTREIKVSIQCAECMNYLFRRNNKLLFINNRYIIDPEHNRVHNLLYQKHI